MVVGGGKDGRGAVCLIGQKWLTGTASLKVMDMEVGPEEWPANRCAHRCMSELDLWGLHIY